jgi:membrane fusion protein (multidrug efflux system)
MLYFETVRLRARPPGAERCPRFSVVAQIAVVLAPNTLAVASLGSSMNALSLRLGALALAIVAAGCQRRGQAAQTPPPEPPIAISTVDVVEKPMPRFLVLTGSLTPNEASDVAANAAGAVLSTAVERGALVEKGAILAKLDARSAALSTAEAVAQANAAKANLDVAKAECERVEKLFKAGAITGADYDKQHAQCTSAEWSTKVADARVNLASKGLGDATVRAPFAGMIAEKYVSAGEYVQPSSKVARVVAIDPLRLEITVPEQSVPLIKVGLDVDFKVTAFNEETFKGSIRYIGPTLRAGSRDLVVEAVVPNTGTRLRPGMFATAKIALGEKPVPVIPINAVRVDGTLRRVFVVVGGHLEERLVKLGEERDGLFEIEQGVATGEKVVSPVKPEAHDGARVK